MKHLTSLSATLCFLGLLITEPSGAQIKLGDGTSEPNPSAVLELESTSKGFLPPRMTTSQRDEISSPSSGMVIFNTSLNCLQVYSNQKWECLGAPTDPPVYPPRLTNQQILALPSPQKGDLAYDLTNNCLRAYTGSKWLCSYEVPEQDPEVALDPTSWRAGGTANDWAHSIAVDAAGNVYVTGLFLGSTIFGETTLTSSGQADIFIAKYNSSGMLVWAQKAGGTGNDQAHDIAVDANGNVYITGEFSGTCTFGDISVAATGSIQIFITKLNSSGTFQWAQRAGGSFWNKGSSIALDGSGNAFITGYISAASTFGSITLNASNSGPDAFVAKYNTEGTAQWAKLIASTGDDQGSGIAVDGSGNVFVVGDFRNTLTLGELSLTSAGNNDIFITKLSGEGNFQWALKAGGSGSELQPELTLDASGNAYMAGRYFSSTASFGDFSLTTSSQGRYVAKVTGAGAYAWATKITDISTPNSNVEVGVSQSGNVFVAGTFSGSATFGAATLTSAGGQDVYLAKLNSTGTLLEAQKDGGATNDWVEGMALTTGGNIYLTGRFATATSLAGVSLTSAGGDDIFIARYKQ